MEDAGLQIYRFNLLDLTYSNVLNKVKTAEKCQQPG